jgi:alpha-L-fucosidase
MKSFQKLFLAIFLNSLFSMNMHAQEAPQKYVAVTDPLVKESLEQWQNMKFGLLMHWGPYSQWGVVESWSICAEDQPWCFQGEDYIAYKQKYERLQETFNPVKFDPASWAKTAHDAGMKYLVFTTKHHDGFCMFDTKATDYRITSDLCPYHTNPKADVTREIFDAFRQEGFVVGAYFSKPDWHSEYFWWPKFATPDRNVNYEISKHPERWEKFVQYTHQQLDELVSNYGKIGILWLDGGWVRPLSAEEQVFSEVVNNLYTEKGYSMLRIPQNQDVRMDEVAENARKKQPGIIIVDRAVEGPHQNYLTPEQQIPPGYLPYPWETCMTMAGSWSYVPNDHYKPTRQLIHTLADIVSKGGNLLLNIGPGPDGTWAPEAYQRLKEIGEWMQVNGEAIYNTRGCEIFSEGQFRFTRGLNGKSYAIYLAGEEEKKLPATILISSLKPLKNCTVSLLGFKGNLKWEKADNGMIIHLPANTGSNKLHQVAWTLSFDKIENK